MLHCAIRTALATAACVLFAASASAYEVQPLIFNLAPAGRDASQTMVVNNTQQRPIVFEIVPEYRLVDETGAEDRAPANDDFLIIPPQARVEPGESQAIRIRYIGAPALPSSEHYVLTVSQIPIAELQENGLQVLVNFAASVQVVPPGARPDVTVAEAELLADEAGAPLARVLLRNDGNRYQGMSAAKLTLSSGELQLELQGDALGAGMSRQLIPGGSLRSGTFALPEDWPTSGPLEVELELPD